RGDAGRADPPGGRALQPGERDDVARGERHRLLYRAGADALRVEPYRHVAQPAEARARERHATAFPGLPRIRRAAPNQGLDRPARPGLLAGARAALQGCRAEFLQHPLDETDLQNLDEEIGQNLKREAELNARVRIGRSRVSEVLTVQSTISTLRAQIEQLQGQRRVAREAFAFLSGLDASTPLNDTEAVPAALEPLADYLVRLELRPDVQAGQQRLTAADENIAVAKGARLPSIDLNGNYYLERSGALRDVDWD